MEHMEEKHLITVEDGNYEEITTHSIELSEAEVEEAAATVAAATNSVRCLLTSSSSDHGTEIQPGSQLPDQILSTEVEEDTEMIIDEANNTTITFQRITSGTSVVEEDDRQSARGQIAVATSEGDDYDKKVVVIHFEPVKDFISIKRDQSEQDSNDSESQNSKIPKLCPSPKDNNKDNGSLASNMQLPFSFPGQSFNEQAQKLILNVWDFFKRAKKDPSLVSNLRGPQDHAAAALNVGTKTIGKIAKRVLRLGKLETPGKKRNRPKTVLDSVGAEGEEVLRNIIREMYERRIAPTIPLVLAEAKTRINFKGSTTSLRRILKRMGFKYGGIDNSLIQSDKSNVSGWKEKASKKGKPWRANQPKSKSINKKTMKPMDEAPIAVGSIAPVPQVVEADGIIQAHEACQQELIQPHEVIIHYQKPDDAYIGQGGQSGILMTADPTQIIQLQLESNGETVPVTVVQEWPWPSGVNETTTILGLKSL